MFKSLNVAETAKCNLCPLSETCTGSKKFKEVNTNAKFAILLSSPHEMGMKPFNDLINEISRNGISRKDIHITFIVLSDIDNQSLADSEKASVESNSMPASIACQDRLNAELSYLTNKNIVSVGSFASNKILGNDIPSSILDIRGTFGENNGFKIVPLLSPGFVLKFQEWTNAFKRDIEYAVKYFNGEVSITFPETNIMPSVEDITKFINESKVITFDIETDGINLNTADVRCIGIGNESKVFIVPFKSKDRKTSFYDYREEIRVKSILSEMFENNSILKVGHNIFAFDLPILRRFLNMNEKKCIDTIQLHRLIEPTMPHSLSYIASRYGIPTAWKSNRSGKIATSFETDEELFRYCGLDVSHTAIIFNEIAKISKTTWRKSFINTDQSVANILGILSTNGIKCNSDEIIRNIELRKDRIRIYTSYIYEIAGKPTTDNFISVVKSLFRKFGLTYTKSLYNIDKIYKEISSINYINKMLPINKEALRFIVCYSTVIESEIELSNIHKVFNRNGDSNYNFIYPKYNAHSNAFGLITNDMSKDISKMEEMEEFGKNLIMLPINVISIKPTMPDINELYRKIFNDEKMTRDENRITKSCKFIESFYNECRYGASVFELQSKDISGAKLSIREARYLKSEIAKITSFDKERLNNIKDFKINGFIENSFGERLDGVYFTDDVLSKYKNMSNVSVFIRQCIVKYRDNLKHVNGGYLFVEDYMSIFNKINDDIKNRNLPLTVELLPTDRNHV